MKKMTKKMMYEQILSHTVDEAERKFLEHELELLAKKNANKSSKPTKTQEANMELKDILLEYLGTCEEGVTVTHMMKNIPECADCSNQKLTALLRQLRIDELVKADKVKGVTLFSLA